MRGQVSPIPLSSSSRRGFTIVELLIVIVVIAILAAITIVSYNGITLRAKNSARIAGVQAIQRSVSLYESQYGSAALRSLLVPGVSQQCIGSDYQDVSPTPDVTCRYTKATNGTESSAVTNQPLYDALQSVAKYRMEYAPVAQKNVNASTDTVISSSPFIYNVLTSASSKQYALDGNSPRNDLFLLSYRLEGLDQNCGIPVVRVLSSTSTLDTYGSGFPYSVTAGGATECWIWLNW